MKLQSLALMTGIAASSIVASGAFAPAQAGTLLTSQAGYTGPVLDLSGYANGNYNYTVGPKLIPGGITFTSNVVLADTQSGFGSVLGQGNYGLDDNGNFDTNPVYAGLDAAKGYMTFSFAAPIQSFGAFLNYAPGYGINPFPGNDPGENPTISTYDSSNNLISTFDLLTASGGAISTPGGLNQFAFRGISEATASIASFRLGGSYILATGTANGAVAATDVPEPFTIVGTLVGGSAALRMRKKLKSSKK
jgi:hypothetical protein